MIQNVKCARCKTEQPPSKTCRNCKMDFASYYCKVCKLWDDDAKTLGSMADAGATVKVMLLGSRRDELAAPPAAWRRLLETVGDGVAWVLPLLRWETLRLGLLGFLRGVGRFFASLVLKQRTE